MKHVRRCALASVSVVALTQSANAADLGRDCCADLEARVAELEATAARKGNRKVSLTVSGWVSQQVSIWDDGVQTKAYVSDLGATLSTNVKFTGQARINADWSAGYVLQIEVYSNDPLLASQGALSNANGSAIGNAGKSGVLQSFWFLKSESLGKLSVGTQSSAADNAAILPDGSGSLVPANYIFFDNNSMFLRFQGQLGNGALTWGNLATCPGIQTGVSADCDGVPNNNIRYDTPVIAGFSASASWGESDIWAVAGRYAGEHAGFKFSTAIAYTESTNAGVVPDEARRKAAALQIGAYIENVPTGLFVYGAYGKDFNSRLTTPAEVAALGPKADGENYYIKPGIRANWLPLGHTVLFGEYGNNRNKQSLALYDIGVTSSTVQQWGVGLVQEIDAAAMSVWLVYRDYSADLSAPTNGGKFVTDDWRVFKIGGLINF